MYDPSNKNLKNITICAQNEILNLKAGTHCSVGRPVAGRPATGRNKNEIGRASWEHQAVGWFGHFGTRKKKTANRPPVVRRCYNYSNTHSRRRGASARCTTPGRCHDFWNSHNRCPSDAQSRPTVTGRCKIG